MCNSPYLRNMTSLYLLFNNYILLLFRKNSRVASNMWISSAGGHFEKEELNSATACVLRELHEELSISPEDIHNLELRYITLRTHEDEIRLNYYFFAHLSSKNKLDLFSNEGTLKWFPLCLDTIKNLEMPLTAKQVLNHYITIGKDTHTLYGCILNNDLLNIIDLD